MPPTSDAASGRRPAPRPARPTSPPPRLAKARPWLLLAPILLFLAVLGAAALVVLRMSFGTPGDEWRGFTLQNYADLADGYFMKSLWLTLRLAFQSMVCAVLLAIPVALAMARTESRLARRLLLAGVLLPLLVNLLLQGYGWLIILGPAGLLNHALLGSGAHAASGDVAVSRAWRVARPDPDRVSARRAAAVERDARRLHLV